MTAAVVTGMVERGDGRIVNVASMAVRDIQPAQGPYATSKAALVSATKTLARELGRSGIRVNAIVPGYIDGPAVSAHVERQAAGRGVPAGVVNDELAARTALGYIPAGDEIAGTIVWLASDLARPVTGQAIDVNAGWWM
jgi:NAD(P)-dependent dehydrogenase (short-subunit alcohol dehydrogenase family)